VHHNAVDRHLATRADQPTLIYVSVKTGIETYSFADLRAEVQLAATSLWRGREQRRPRATLHAMIAGDVCKACAHRGDSLRGVRAVSPAAPGVAH
jgi:hypothetical protein